MPFFFYFSFSVVFFVSFLGPNTIAHRQGPRWSMPPNNRSATVLFNSLNVNCSAKRKKCRGFITFCIFITFYTLCVKNVSINVCFYASSDSTIIGITLLSKPFLSAALLFQEDTESFHDISSIWRGSLAVVSSYLSFSLCPTCDFDNPIDFQYTEPARPGTFRFDNAIVSIIRNTNKPLTPRFEDGPTAYADVLW